MARTNKITLIEALPFARDLQTLSHKFQTANFDNVFRTTKISIRKPSNGIFDTSGTSPPSAVEATSAPQATTWVSKALQTPSPSLQSASTTRPADTPKSDGNVPTTHTKVIYKNALGQRIDKPIIHTDKSLVYDLKKRKLCNKHYLLGSCPGPEFCTLMTTN